MTHGRPETLDRLSPVLVHHIVNTLGWRSLRPLQGEAIGPVLDGKDALLLAPTAGGKTEAALFPLLTAMEKGAWTGLSVLYVCPIKALLNNLLPRLETYTAWLGRRAALWHGDVSQPVRRRLVGDPPDVLLTTPESLESMLVSVNVDHTRFLSGIRAIVVDEVHAFAGDDRGWHLLAVLERLAGLTGRPIQRVGLSATVGNPAGLLDWLQGAGRGRRPAQVVDARQGTSDRTAPVASDGDIELDYVGSVSNAAKVIAALHAGEKRLVFCDSRQLVEEIGAGLRARGITTFLSHASLSVDERRRAEAAFAEARDCVIVSTSTLELGIDVGDLDRVIQINAPAGVASFLQRLGRTGRRPGTVRNCLFLCLDQDALLSAAALLLLWKSGYVEPVIPPPEPRHIVAQQVLALCLQKNAIGRRTWQSEWNGLAPFDRSAEPIVAYLVEQGFVERDGELLFIGPAAEEKFGRRNFMDMTAVFTAPPEFTVLSGRREIGRADPLLLTEKREGPRVLLLAGRSWHVTRVDWKRRHCFVEPSDRPGKARWSGTANSGSGFAMARARRDVLLGAIPDVRLTERAVRKLADVRTRHETNVHPNRTVITQVDGDTRWWTWAGASANGVLSSSLTSVADEDRRVDDQAVRLRDDLTPEIWRAALTGASGRLCLPHVDERALQGLKFSAALPPALAAATLGARLADLDGARSVLAEPIRFSRK